LLQFSFTAGGVSHRRRIECLQAGMEERIKEIDGLRAIAILLVIAWHYVGVPSGPRSLLWNVFYLGHFGVDLFFVLSGFLIGSILINARRADNYFRSFYGRRALRIWPLYYLMVAAAFVGMAVRPNSALFSGSLPDWTYLLSVQNFAMAHYQSYGSFWLGGTWSLAIEEQFYLIFPLIVRFVAPRYLPRILLGVIVLCPIARLADSFTSDEYGYYVLPFFRADVLSIGALIAWWRIYGRGSTPDRVATICLIGSTLLLPLVIFTGTETFHAAAWQHTLAAIFFGSLLFKVLGYRGSNSLAWLRGRAAAFFARTSYCAYLTHHWIAYLVFGALGVVRTIDTFAGCALTAVSFIATFALSAASYRWMERHLIRFGHRRFSYDKAPVDADAGARPAAA
jgi:peptidoglycan/LPS O-acetylase OafA/YrhL